MLLACRLSKPSTCTPGHVITVVSFLIRCCRGWRVDRLRAGGSFTSQVFGAPCLKTHQGWDVPGASLKLEAGDLERAVVALARDSEEVVRTKKLPPCPLRGVPKASQDPRRCFLTRSKSHNLHAIERSKLTCVGYLQSPQESDTFGLMRGRHRLNSSMPAEVDCCL